jgi:hypothetical protein
MYQTCTNFYKQNKTTPRAYVDSNPVPRKTKNQHCTKPVPSQIYFSLEADMCRQLEKYFHLQPAKSIYKNCDSRITYSRPTFIQTLSHKVKHLHQIPKHLYQISKHLYQISKHLNRYSLNNRKHTYGHSSRQSKLKYSTHNRKSRNLYKSRKPTNLHKKCTTQHRNDKSPRFEKLTSKPPPPHLHLQNTKPLETCLLTLAPRLHNPHETQGHANRNIFKDQEAPSHISNSASKDNSRTTNSHHSS